MSKTKTFVQDVNAGFIRVTELINLVRDNSQSKRGDLTALNTADKTSLVNALNELKQSLNSSSSIDDAQTTTSNTWSASKIDTAITTAINDLLGGADAESDSLKELADKITALSQADNGLLSVKQPQTLTSEQQKQGQSNLNVHGKDEIGDIDNADFVATINQTYNN